MKIARIGISCYYTPGMTYQDNLLTEQNIRDGHEVLYISNAAKFENGVIVETGYEDTMLDCNVRLIRLPYVHVLHRMFYRRLVQKALPI